MNDITSLPGLGAPGPTIVERGPVAEPAAPGFQALLERLQRLARTPSATPPAAPAADANADPTTGLRDALRAADDSYHTAMDVRRRLEEAFQKHTP